jgi:hypothetical protein
MTKTLQLLNRSRWLVTWLQKRRRARQHRLLPAPVLRAAYPTLLQWDWNLANPYKWNVWTSLDGGVSYFLTEDYWHYGDSRQFAPDGGSELYFIVGVDAGGKEITHRSNAVRPDDAPAPVAAPVIDEASYGWNAGSPDYADIEVGFSFNHGSYPPASMEVWVSRDAGAFVLLATVDSFNSYFLYEHATENEASFDFKLRYVNGATVGPFSNVMHVNVQV